MGTTIEFTDQEMVMIGISLLMSAKQIAASRDVVQFSLDHNMLDGLDEILPAMEIVDIAQQELELLEQIASKIERIIHSEG